MDLPNAYHIAGVSVQRAKTYVVGGRIASCHFARETAFERMVTSTAASGRPLSGSAGRGARRVAQFGDGS